jgi:DNA gyrase/topoisomerase IV subunit B
MSGPLWTPSPERIAQLTDKRGVEVKETVLHYEGGLKAFVEYLDRAKQPLIPAPVMIATLPSTRAMSAYPALV